MRAVRLEGASLVFKLRGVKPVAVTGARLRIGSFKRRLSGRKVRRGTRRGVLKVRLPKRVRRTLKKQAARAPAGKPAPVVVQQARLVVTTGDNSDPRKSCTVPQDAHYVSPSGSDSGPGTAAQPWRTLDKAESESKPGMTVVIRGGSYGALGHVTYLEASGNRTAPITWMGAPRETALIHGHMAIDGNSRRLCGLVFDGPTGPTSDPMAGNPEREQDKIYVAGDDVEIANSEVRGTRWHSGIYVAGGDQFRIVNNYIHDNGRFDDPSHANLDHGVYIGEGSGLIQGNRIDHNYAYGVQLYPNAHDVTVRGNTITRHGRAAVIMAEDAKDNLVEGNTVHGNRRGIQAWSLRGTGNKVRSNELWDNHEGNLLDLGGVSVSGNNSH